jgi:hypothetical protein
MDFFLQQPVGASGMTCNDQKHRLFPTWIGTNELRMEEAGCCSGLGSVCEIPSIAEQTNKSISTRRLLLLSCKSVCKARHYGERKGLRSVIRIRFFSKMPVLLIPDTACDLKDNIEAFPKLPFLSFSSLRRSFLVSSVILQYSSVQSLPNRCST